MAGRPGGSATPWTIWDGVGSHPKAFCCLTNFHDRTLAKTDPQNQRRRRENQEHARESHGAPGIQRFSFPISKLETHLSAKLRFENRAPRRRSFPDKGVTNRRFVTRILGTKGPKARKHTSLGWSEAKAQVWTPKNDLGPTARRIPPWRCAELSVLFFCWAVILGRCPRLVCAAPLALCFTRAA